MKSNRISSRPQRFAALALLCAILLGSLCGCGIIIINGDEDTTEEATTVTPETSTAPETGDVTEPEDTEEETEPLPDVTVVIKPVTFPSRIEDAEDRLDSLTDLVDISDFDLVYASSKDTVELFFPDEEAPLYAAYSNRNSMLHEKYEVDILSIYESVDTDTLFSDLSAAIKSGDGAEYYLDMLVLPANRAGVFLANGLLQDMRKLPFYNVKEGPTAGNIGPSRYFDTGDGTDAPELIYALYFNRTAVGAEAEKKLYSSALDGSLTFDSLFEVQSEAAITVCGFDNGLAGRLAVSLSGYEYVTHKDSTTQITLTAENAAAIDALLSRLSAALKAPGTDTVTAAEAFMAGASPFYIGTLSDIEQFYDKPTEWGILTLPSDCRMGAIADSRPVICVPVTNTRPEQLGLWLTAFNAASGDWIRDQYLAEMIENRLRDNNSCLTLFEILSREANVDFTLLFSDRYKGLAEATYLAAAGAVRGELSFSGTLAANIAALNKKLQSTP